MCAHCRRTRQRTGEAWDWVPGLVEQPLVNVSHGLCRICLEYHLARREAFAREAGLTVRRGDNVQSPADEGIVAVLTGSIYFPNRK